MGDVVVASPGREDEKEGGCSNPTGTCQIYCKNLLAENSHQGPALAMTLFGSVLRTPLQNLWAKLRRVPRTCQGRCGHLCVKIGWQAGPHMPRSGLMCSALFSPLLQDGVQSPWQQGPRPVLPHRVPAGVSTQQYHRIGIARAVLSCQQPVRLRWDSPVPA